jgi:hypothetical protein
MLHATTPIVRWYRSAGPPHVPRPLAPGWCDAAPQAYAGWPSPGFNAVAAYRTELVVGVACLFTGEGLAALCARVGLPLVLGPARARHAIPGGKANHATIEAHTMARGLRGGLRPQAEVSPGEAPQDGALA